MSTNDEKEWLRAVLEGRVKPGDEAWERMWREPEFARVRGVLREVGMMERGDVVFDRDKMWRAIEAYRGEGRNVRRRVRAWRWAAAAVLVLLAGGAAWMLSEREPARRPVAQAVEIEAGGPRAVLIMAEGERIDLTQPVDTVLERDGVEIFLDSARGVTYQPVKNEAEKMAYNTIVVPRKGEYRVTLADGSTVHLNSESELRFPTAFTGKERRVYLKGEGYFEVERDTVRPFVVAADETEVRVLGTRFNVNAYDAEDVTRTTLMEGKVSVGDSVAGKAVVLSPGWQAEWRGGNISTRKVNVKAVVAWIDGKFYFEEGATLEEITEQLRRWYDIDFFFTSERVKRFMFAGVIRKDYTANEIFSIIEKTTNVRFDVKGRTVVVGER